MTDGWSSGEDDTVKTRTQSKPVAAAVPRRWASKPASRARAAPTFVSRAAAPPPPAPPEEAMKDTIMKDYESDGWSSSDDEPMKPAPPEPMDTERQTSGMLQPSESARKMFQSRANEVKNRAQRISAGAMETKYGVGFSLMSKMGLSKDVLKTASTPMTVEPRAKDQGIVVGESSSVLTTQQKHQPQAGGFRSRVRSRAEFESQDAHPAMTSSEDGWSSSSDGGGGTEAFMTTAKPAPPPSRQVGARDPARVRKTSVKNRAPPQTKESLRQTVETSRSQHNLAMRGDTHKFPEQTLSEVSQPKQGPVQPYIARPSETDEPGREKRLDELCQRITELENRLVEKCTERKNESLQTLKADYVVSTAAQEVKLEGLVKREDNDEDKMTFGGGFPAAPAPAAVPKQSVVASIPVIQQLMLEWLCDEIMVLERDFPSEMTELNFAAYVDKFVEFALLADLAYIPPPGEAASDTESSNGCGPGRSELALAVGPTEDDRRDKSHYMALWTRIFPLTARLRIYIVGQPENPNQSRVFDEIMRRTVLARFLEPFLRHNWDVMGDSEVAVDLVEGDLSQLVTRKELDAILNDLVLVLLINTLETERTRLNEVLPHLWLLPWLPVLPRDGVEVLLEKVVETALWCFDQQHSVRVPGEVESNDEPLVVETWVKRWKEVLSRDQWERVIYQGAFGRFKRWLLAEQPPTLSTKVPDAITGFLEVWGGEIPAPLVTSTIIDFFGRRLLSELTAARTSRFGAGGPPATGDQAPAQPSSFGSIEALLDGFGSWKILRKEHLPDLKSFLRDLLTLLERAV